MQESHVECSMWPWRSLVLPLPVSSLSKLVLQHRGAVVAHRLDVPMAVVSAGLCVLFVN